MRRRRADEDAKTHPHTRALERGEGSADAIFRSFVQRSSPPGAQLRVPTDRTHSPSTELPADTTPAEGIDLGGTDPDLARDPGDATDPRIPMRWAETVEQLLEQGISELQTDAQEGVLLLTTRKSTAGEQAASDPYGFEQVEPATFARRGGSPRSTETALPEPAAQPSEREPTPPPTVRPPGRQGMLEPSLLATRIDHDRTTAMQASELAVRLRAAGPPSAEESASTRVAPAPPSSRSSEEWHSVVRAPSETTQKREALRLVPDVAQVEVPEPPPHERSEDGLIPSGVLDRKLGDMAVLLRYGHEAQVRQELEHLRSRYAQDLLLARRIAEFYLANERPALALEQLFSLASGLFERRNVEGMRQALEQVLVIDPENERAARLLGLLDQRPVDPASAPPGGRNRR
jgi:hypothetical protein